MKTIQKRKVLMKLSHVFRILLKFRNLSSLFSQILWISLKDFARYFWKKIQWIKKWQRKPLIVSWYIHFPSSKKKLANRTTFEHFFKVDSALQWKKRRFFNAFDIFRRESMKWGRNEMRAAEKEGKEFSFMQIVLKH